MALSVTLSDYDFGKNDTTQVTLTVSGASTYQGVAGYIFSENDNVKVSLTGSSFSNEVVITQNGTYTLHVQVGNVTIGEYNNILYYDFLGMDNPVAFSINVIDSGVTLHIENLSFSLSPRNSTTLFNCNFTNSTINVGTVVSDTILDYPYSFEAERVTEQGLKTVVGGSSFATKLTQSLIQYHVIWRWNLNGWHRPQFSDHLSAISSAIGIPIVRIGANFYPKTDLSSIAFRHGGLSLDFNEYFSGTFAECLSRLIGWSNDVPMMAYNVFIKNGTIYIVQQGSETNQLTPTNWTLRPTVTHSIRHTEWANSASLTLPKEISSSDAVNSNTPFSGTLSFGQSTLTYSDGYLTQETHGNITTTFTYTDYADAKYLTLKESTDSVENTLVKCEYTYEQTDTDYYLHEEVVGEYDIVSDGQGGTTYVLNKETTTRHVPIGGGWYGTSVYDTTNAGTEDLISDSLSQGAPGNKASQYLIDEANDSLRDNSTPRQLTVQLNGVAKARQQYPVADQNTLQAIANKLDTYEGSEEIVLQGEIAGGTHIYTYDDTIMFNNAEYHLVSNNVSQTNNAIRQNITAVRWVV